MLIHIQIHYFIYALVEVLYCILIGVQFFVQGLVETFNTLLPGVDHRFCVRHLYANFKEKFKGKDLKDLVWVAACSYTVQDWEENMNKVKTINSEAHA